MPLTIFMTVLHTYMFINIENQVLCLKVLRNIVNNLSLIIFVIYFPVTLLKVYYLVIEPIITFLKKFRV